MSQPLYSIGTWDQELEAFTPQVGVPAFNLTRSQLRQSMKALKRCGYGCYRLRDPDGSHDTNDTWVLIERTDGKSESEILEQWKR